MRKGLIFSYIISIIICQGIVLNLPTQALSDNQKFVIIDYCDAMKDTLKNLQKSDSRARVYLGQHYEAILSQFIVPLNVRLVENSISNADLLENQTELTKQKASFTSDYITYQQMLEELILVNCKEKPEEFYEKLLSVRRNRETVRADVLKMRELVSKHVSLVKRMGQNL